MQIDKNPPSEIKNNTWDFTEVLQTIHNAVKLAKKTIHHAINLINIKVHAATA